MKVLMVLLFVLGLTLQVMADVIWLPEYNGDMEVVVNGKKTTLYGRGGVVNARRIILL